MSGFTRSIARDLILELLSAEPTPRWKIIELCVGVHTERGGGFPYSPTGIIEKALEELASRRLISRPQRGIYCTIDAAKEDGYTSPALSPFPLLDQRTPDVDGTSYIGQGGETVYVWYSSDSRTLAEERQEIIWKCKIGMAQHTHQRVHKQATALCDRPVVGLVIRCDNAKLVETLIHKTLAWTCRQVQNSIGTEWFWTSPTEVKNLYKTLCAQRTDYLSATPKRLMTAAS